MKKRLIALAVALCMMLSVIPVRAAEANAAAGVLTESNVQTVTLDAGEEVYYTFAAKGNTPYYYYLCEDGTDLGFIEIRPEGDGISGEGTSYQYSGYTGTLFVTHEDGTVNIILINHGDSQKEVKVGVAQVTDGAASMSLNTTSMTVELGKSDVLIPIFDTVFTFNGDVTYSAPDDGIVIIRENPFNAEIIGMAEGTTTVTVTSGSLSATCNITVTNPSSAAAVSVGAPVSVTVPANEYYDTYLSFTAPADATANTTYVISCPEEQDVALDPVGVLTDNFVVQNNKLVLYTGLSAGQTVYMLLTSFGAFGGSLTVTAQESTAPSSFSLAGSNTLAEGDDLHVEPVFASINEYVPVTWSVDDSSVLEMINTGSYSAEFNARGTGTAKVTATTASGVSATLEVTVTGTAAIPTTTITDLDTPVTVEANSDFRCNIEFTPAESGLYMVGNNAFNDPSPTIEAVSPVITSNFDHDLVMNDVPYCGPVYELAKDVTYTFTLNTQGNSTVEMMICKGEHATSITPQQTEVTGYVGGTVMLGYDVEPYGAFNGINTSVSSDETVAVEMGGNCAEPVRHIQLLKAGTATITVTTASGLTAAVKVTVKEPEPLTLDNEVTTLVPSQGSKAYSVAVTAGEKYCFYVSGLGLGSHCEGDGYCLSYGYAQEDTCYDCQIFTAEQTGTVIYYVDNFEEEARSVSLGVTKCAAPTSIEFTQTTYVTFVGWGAGLSAMFQPALAYDENVTYTISGDAISLDDFYGHEVLVYAEKAGTATVTATTSSGAKATATVVVKLPQTLTVDQNVSLSLTPGDKEGYYFTAPEAGWYCLSSTGLFNYGLLTENDAYGTNIEQPCVYLNQGGELFVTVEPEWEDASGTIAIHKAASATGVSVADLSGVVGYLGRSMVTLTPNGSYLPGMAEWSVADESVAQIVGGWYNGVIVEYLKAGTTTLTLTMDGKTYTSAITVTDPIVVSTDTSVPATVTPEAVDSALEEAVANAASGETVEVVVSVSAAAEEAGTTVSAVELPVASLEAVAEAEAVLTVEVSTGTVTIDTAALESITEQAEGQQVVLNVREVEVEELTARQQKAAQKLNVAAVITAELICPETGETIWTKDSKATSGNITVRLPFTPEKGYTMKNYTILFLDDDGKLEKIKTEYDEENGCLIFTLKHFSDYVVARDPVLDNNETEPEETKPQETTPGTTNPNTGESFPVMWLGMLMLLSALAVTVLAAKKRRA